MSDNLSFDEYFKELHRALLDFRRSIINGQIAIPDLNDESIPLQNKMKRLKDAKRPPELWETEFNKFKSNRQRIHPIPRRRN